MRIVSSGKRDESLDQQQSFNDDVNIVRRLDE